MECKVQDVAGITIALGNATFSAMGTAATTTYTSLATPFAINGKAYTFAAKTTQAFPTTDINTGLQYVGLQAVNTGTVFVLGVNASAAIVVAQGSVESLDAAGNFINAPKFPSLPDNFCPLGYLVVKAGSTLAAPFYPGTGNWNQTGATNVVQNCVSLPDRPQVA